MSAPIPPVSSTPHGKSALTRILERTTLSVRAHITDTFTSLANWVVIANNPTITSGMLTGKGAVRYIDQMATDNYTVTATVGAANDGKTWLITCATQNLDRFYAVEINRNTGFFGVSNFSIIKATGVLPTPSADIFGMLLGLITMLFGFFFSIGGTTPVPRYATVTQTVSVNDTVRVWWDEANSTVRAYKNGAQVTSLVVPSGEIPHGDDSRYFGVIQGADNTVGVQFTSIDAQDFYGVMPFVTPPNAVGITDVATAIRGLPVATATDAVGLTDSVTVVQGYTVPAPVLQIPNRFVGPMALRLRRNHVLPQ